MPGTAAFKKSRTLFVTRGGRRGGAEKSSRHNEGLKRAGTEKARSAACSVRGLGRATSNAGENPTDKEGVRICTRRSRDGDCQGFKERRRSQGPILFDTWRASNVRSPALSCIAISQTERTCRSVKNIFRKSGKQMRESLEEKSDERARRAGSARR